MRLKKLVINNFRNYNGKVEFDLSKNITIFYGDNGNGKSSFFDAIEWVITGEISRFSLKTDLTKEIVANNKMKDDQTCSVSLSFDNYVMKREFKKKGAGECSNTSLSLNDGKQTIKGIGKVEQKLSEILSQTKVNGNWDNKTLSKAYILSQDQVMDFIAKDKPEERYNALASLMGFERVNNFKINLSTTSRVIENKINKLSDEKNNLEKELKSENNILEKGLDELNIDVAKLSDYTNIEDNFVELTKIKNRSSDLQNDRNKLSKIDFYGENALKGIEKLRNINENSLKEVTTKKEGRLQKQAKLKSEFEKLGQDKKVAEQQSLVLNQYKEISVEIQKLQLKLKDYDVEYKNTLLQETSERIDKISANLKKYNYYFEKQSILEENKAIIEDRNSKIIELEKESKILGQRFEENVLNLENLSEEFSQGEVLESIKKLLSLVSDARAVVLNDSDEYKDKCPVCGSSVDDMNTLLSKKLKKLTDETGEHKKIIEENLNNKKKLEQEIEEINKARKNLDKKIKKIRSEISESNEKIYEIKKRELFDEEIFSKSLSDVTKFYEIEEKELKIQQDIFSISEKFGNYKAEISKHESDSNFELNPINLTELNKKINDMENALNDLKVELGVINKELTNLNEKKTLFTSSISNSEELFTKYKLDTVTDLSDYFSTEIEKCEVREKEVLKEISEVSKFKELLKLNTKIEKLKEKNVVLQNQKNYYSDKKEKIDLMIEEINKNYGNKASDFLNSSSSQIKKYYQYLNPNPAEFSDLIFDVQNDNQLEIKIKNEDKNTIANHVLSSGQLNVLAMSIFIATNIAQTYSHFDFIAIDDPIQNMDDVNRFSITDVLSQLDKQLIFSTHDSDYVNLFIKKNENRIDDIAVYYLNSDKNEYKNILSYK